MLCSIMWLYTGSVIGYSMVGIGDSMFDKLTKTYSWWIFNVTKWFYYFIVHTGYICFVKLLNQEPLPTISRLNQEPLPGWLAPGFLKLILCGLSVCVLACVCVCPHPRLSITSGVIYNSYDWLNKFYSCYMATVVVIVNGRGLGIGTRRRH